MQLLLVIEGTLAIILSPSASRILRNVVDVSQWNSLSFSTIPLSPFCQLCPSWSYVLY